MWFTKHRENAGEEDRKLGYAALTQPTRRLSRVRKGSGRFGSDGIGNTFDSEQTGSRVEVVFQTDDTPSGEG